MSEGALEQVKGEDMRKQEQSFTNHPPRQAENGAENGISDTQREGQPPNDRLYSRPCVYFRRGRCTKGENCGFSHDKRCVFYARGYCVHGDNCKFSHDKNLDFENDGSATGRASHNGGGGDRGYGYGGGRGYRPVGYMGGFFRGDYRPRGRGAVYRGGHPSEMRGRGGGGYYRNSYNGYGRMAGGFGGRGGYDNGPSNRGGGGGYREHSYGGSFGVRGRGRGGRGYRMSYNGAQRPHYNDMFPRNEGFGGDNGSFQT